MDALRRLTRGVFPNFVIMRIERLKIDGINIMDLSSILVKDRKVQYHFQSETNVVLVEENRDQWFNLGTYGYDTKTIVIYPFGFGLYLDILYGIGSPAMADSIFDREKSNISKIKKELYKKSKELGFKIEEIKI